MHAGNRSIFQILACVTVFVHVFHCIFAGIKAGLDSWRKMPYVYAEYTVIKVFFMRFCVGVLRWSSRVPVFSVRRITKH